MKLLPVYKAYRGQTDLVISNVIMEAGALMVKECNHNNF